MLTNLISKIPGVSLLPWLVSMLLMLLWIEIARAELPLSSTENEVPHSTPGILTRFQNYALFVPPVPMIAQSC